ncbi:hypothetical protein VTK73DRAFT_4829 [Phialemonium thermophilum]|uniref:Uncharacterized protein n=1 Tax=Phialemonium thermophilum TaxID=223376 RepID=A0ABR3V623_9PEZI
MGRPSASKRSGSTSITSSSGSESGERDRRRVTRGRDEGTVAAVRIVVVCLMGFVLLVETHQGARRLRGERAEGNRFGHRLRRGARLRLGGLRLGGFFRRCIYTI